MSRLALAVPRLLFPLALLLALPAVTGASPQESFLNGDVLIGEAGCINCHSVGSQVPEWVLPQEAPVLTDVGRRITPQYLRRYLKSPRDAHPGTRMPDILGGLPEAERDTAVDELLHYLVSLGGPADQSAVAADAGAVVTGELLFHRVGCVACHGPMSPPTGGTEIPADAPVHKALPELAWKTTVPELAAFLMDPRKDRPAGRMPSLKLEEDEARNLAIYLLRGQDVDENGNPRPPERFPGVRYHYYEATINANEPDFDQYEPVRSGSINTFTVDLERRNDHFGLVFEGLVNIPTTGEWEFFTESDDGSRLAIDGEWVVKNDGTHGMVEKGGKVHLEAGEHGIKATVFEHGGGEGLIVRWKGPGVDKQVIPDEALSHESRSLGPLFAEDFQVDADKAARGRDRFVALGCASCHATDQPKQTGTAPPLASVNPAAGCLSATPPVGVPGYAFSAEQRNDIAASISRAARWKQGPSPHEAIERSLTALNCTACHQRGQLGGPTPGNDRYFTMATDADIGDEGRIPPPLHDVGRKLRPGWLREVLVDGASVRPYMHTRMPQFGEENSAPILDMLALVDRGVDVAVTEPEFDLELIEAGRTLMGLKGLSCINCHSFQGHASLGMPGPDLAFAHRRIEYPWFRDFLYKPSTLRPGTRMPSFYEEEQADLDILGRDKARQIDALWTYLSLGGSAPLPHGIKVDANTYELIPVDVPRLVGVFMRDMSAKVVAVGFPERAHYAWDSVHLRMGRVWRGDFLNVEGTWHGRAGQLEMPRGDDVLDLPPGSPFAFLSDGQTWPEETGPDLGARKLGVRYDRQRRPVHRYQIGDVTVEEKPYPVLRQGGSWMIREFRLHSPTRPRGLTFRAAVGDTIQKQGADWQVDQQRLRFSDSVEPFTRNAGDGPELLIFLDEAGGTGAGSWMLDFHVEMSW